MIAQFIKFETSLSEEKVIAISKERMPQFQKVPGLVQKHYLKLDEPNHYGGFYMWESREAMAAFRETELAKTIPSAYQIVRPPEITVQELLFSLRPDEMALAAQAIA